MKIAMHKHDMTRWCQDYEVEQFKSSGWTECVDANHDHGQVKAIEEIIRLKPTVKAKATVKALEEANDKGDE
jgi:hypothetical protein